MTNYEIFLKIWIGAMVLLVSLIVFLMIGRVGHNDLRHALNDPEYVNNSFLWFEWED